MAESYFAWKITTAANRAPRMRSRQDGFALDETDFVQLFRLSKHAARDLCEDLRPYLAPVSRRADCLTVETKVLCALHFYATGSYQMPVGNELETALPQSSQSLYPPSDGCDAAPGRATAMDPLPLRLSQPPRHQRRLL